MRRIPFLVLTDGPTLPSGLARIGRDLIRAILQTKDLADRLELVQLSVQPQGRFGWSGWPVYAVDDLKTYGAEALPMVWKDCFGDRDGIVFTIWDPSRIIQLSGVAGPWQLWGYVPVDSHNLGGGLSGPHGAAIARYHRVLAYTKWGARILKSVRDGEVQWLPHGLEDDWRPNGEAENLLALRTITPRADHWVLGMVATNQPRKDLGMFFQTLAELRNRGQKVHGWLHTDQLVNAWSIGQLALDCRLGRRLTVTLQLSDTELAACYGFCDVTMLASGGEGFGYPIVESLACGTPCVHTTFGGGAELVPRSEWRVPARAMRLDGPYALERPVFAVEDFANAVMRAYLGRTDDTHEYCSGAVEHLRWKHLWNRWATWFRQGLDAFDD